MGLKAFDPQRKLLCDTTDFIHKMVAFGGAIAGLSAIFPQVQKEVARAVGLVAKVAMMATHWCSYREADSFYEAETRPAWMDAVTHYAKERVIAHFKEKDLSDCSVLISVGSDRDQLRAEVISMEGFHSIVVDAFRQKNIGSDHEISVSVSRVVDNKAIETTHVFSRQVKGLSAYFDRQTKEVDRTQQVLVSLSHLPFG